MTADEQATLAVINDYATGVLSRTETMKRLGLIWYGQLYDAMEAAGLRRVYDEAREELMVQQVVDLLLDHL